jgi:hypothetical protein
VTASSTRMGDGITRRYYCLLHSSPSGLALRPVRECLAPYQVPVSHSALHSRSRLATSLALPTTIPGQSLAHSIITHDLITDVGVGRLHWRTQQQHDNHRHTHDNHRHTHDNHRHTHDNQHSQSHTSPATHRVNELISTPPLEADSLPLLTCPAALLPSRALACPAPWSVYRPPCRRC